jgi:photosystem II stability/assembly factor-like uncharacterized protein
VSFDLKTFSRHFPKPGLFNPVSPGVPIRLIAIPLVLILLLTGCMVAGERRVGPSNETVSPVIRLHMGVSGVTALRKTSVIKLKRLDITFVSSANDTVRDSVTTLTSPALDSSTATLQTVSKTYDLKALRSWKIIAISHDRLDSVVHRDSAFIPALYAGDTADVALSLAARYALYEAKFLNLPDSLESSIPAQPKQVLHINRLVLRIDGVVVRDSMATPGPYFTPGADHILGFDYVPAGTGAWTPVATGTTKNLNAIQFPTSDTGYIVGDTIALKTVDGGATWSALSGGSPRSMRYVSFSTSNGLKGVLGGDSATVSSTSDGGSSWTVQKISNFTNRASPFALVNDTGFGFTVSPTPGGSTGSRRTLNGGATWTTIGSFGNNVYAMHCLSTSACWAVGYAGMIRKNTSEDGYFATVLTSGTTKALYGVRFLDANLGFAVGDTGVILKTTNGGSSWSTQTSGTTQNLRAIYFIDSAIGYAVGHNGTILGTSNGGTSWSVQPSGTTQNLSGLWFSGATGFAVGNGGTLLKMNDVRSVEMLAYGPFGSWDTANPLFSGVRYINVASGLDATVTMVLRWRGPSTGTGVLNAEVGKVGKVTVNGSIPDGVIP